MISFSLKAGLIEQVYVNLIKRYIHFYDSAIPRLRRYGRDVSINPDRSFTSNLRPPS
ncbi:MAG: hypothetical protein QOH42_2474 [Blastocatellia bacterium]|nr:hypothetical protein [Blastocatellia bacterium]